MNKASTLCLYSGSCVKASEAGITPNLSPETYLDPIISAAYAKLVNILADAVNLDKESS